MYFLATNRTTLISPGVKKQKQSRTYERGFPPVKKKRRETERSYSEGGFSKEVQVYYYSWSSSSFGTREGTLGSEIDWNLSLSPVVGIHPSIHPSIPLPTKNKFRPKSTSCSGVLG